jgi:hypothetical protein
MTVYDVRIWELRKLDGRRRPWQVRWTVSGSEKSRTFATKALAEGLRSELNQSARRGEAFDKTSGLPAKMARAPSSRSWLDHARAYVDMKWPKAAANSRESIAESLATVSPALVKARGGGAGQPRAAPRPHRLGVLPSPPSHHSTRRCGRGTAMAR